MYSISGQVSLLRQIEENFQINLYSLTCKLEKPLDKENLEYMVIIAEEESEKEFLISNNKLIEENQFQKITYSYKYR